MTPRREFKIVMIGKYAVGKTALTNRLQYAQFEEEYQPTVGAGYVSHVVSIDGEEVELQIWDTAGMDRYRSLGPIYYRDSVGAILVFDQTDRSSVDDLTIWLAAFKAVVTGESVISVAANKNDLDGKIDLNSVRQWAHENHFDFCSTSAKTGDGVTELFDNMVRNILESRIVAPDPVPVIPVEPAGPYQIAGCC
jgi:small GTP-binding protein